MIQVTIIWNRTNESVPEQGKKVLVSGTDCVDRPYVGVSFLSNDGNWYDDYGDTLEVTHWADLPEHVD